MELYATCADTLKRKPSATRTETDKFSQFKCGRTERRRQIGTNVSVLWFDAEPVLFINSAQNITWNLL